MSAKHDRVPENALVAVCDGAKARLFRNTAPKGGLQLKELRQITLQDVTNDGPSGSQPADQSHKQTDEATFAKQVVHTLATMQQSGEFSELVLVAAPHSLGEMRHAMHKNLEKATAFTIAKDWTNLPLGEITKMLEKSSED